MKDKKNLVIGLLCVAVCVMAVGYAAFSSILNINGTASITSTWNVEIINIVPNKTTTNTGTAQNPVYTTSGDISHSYTGTTANFSAALISPGDSVVYTVTVKNKGTIPAVVNDIVGTELGSDAIEFSIAGIAKGDTLAVNGEKSFTVTVGYKSSVTGQPAITDNQITVNITYVQDLGQSISPTDINIEPQRLYSKIMQAYTPVSDASIDFSYSSEGRQEDDGEVTASQVTNGLYYTSDLTKTENGQRVYYFRGNVNNNYVKFGTSDARTCKYNGEEVWLADVANVTVSQVTTSSECSLSNVCLLPGVVVDQLTGGSGNAASYVVGAGVNDACSQYGGTLYGEAEWDNSLIWRIVRINEDGSIRMVTQDSVGNAPYDNTEDETGHYTNVNYVGSPVETALNTFYTNNLQQYDGLIADAGFCNDTSIGRVDGNITYYGATIRLADNKTPQYKCNTTILKTSTGLTKKIGLLTADEVAYAGGLAWVKNVSSYLANNESWAWTISPWGSDSDGSSSVWRVDSDGNVGVHDVDSDGSLRPAVNLVSNIEVASGSGTASDPWVIKTN